MYDGLFGLFTESVNYLVILSYNKLANNTFTYNLLDKTNSL
jgi:hypothetical protein